MDITLKESQAPKAKVMLWTDVSYHDMDEIDKLQSTPDLESALCSLFQVDLPEPKRGVLLELYVQTVLFCREHSFKKEQTSALLSIIKSIHEANVGTPLNIEQCYKYCNELLLCHSVRRPPFSVSLFSSEEVTHVLKYIHNNYMRHYKLYKYIFTPQQKLDLSLTYTGIPDDDEQTLEDFVVPDMMLNIFVISKRQNIYLLFFLFSAADDKKVLEEVDPRSPEMQESSAEPTGATLASNSELKALIQQEVREQMMIMSGQLDQRMKDNQRVKK
ncbi:cilia- and flagella-associated protein 119 [Sphaeramia orbicularis]|uniref:cilia- and flagella-associated protein 119 n=1 Tax=Sphaeramia orbicularis TaxID=375764 RepID=UPI0011800356|nr:coiled-coil domain-containing protein 189 [Sphaeramia orbicularis]